MTTSLDPRALPLAERIRWARKRTGLGQIAFAQRLGTTQRHVSRWENGHHRPGPQYLRRIAEETGQHLDFFTDDEGGGGVTALERALHAPSHRRTTPLKSTASPPNPTRGRRRRGRR